MMHAISRIKAVAMLALGAAALISIEAPSGAQTATTIRIAALPVESSAEVFYAKDMGFFAKAGLDVEIQTMQGSPAIAAGITSNALDIGYGVLDTLASIHVKNIPIVVVAPASEYLSPGSERYGALVLPPNSPVQNAKDLDGKTFAVTAFNSLGETAPRVWIDKNGGDSTAVKFVEIPFPAMPAALAAGRIDAAWVAEPFIGAATKNGRVLAYGFVGIAKHFLMSAWYSTPQWVSDHPDLVKRFASVMHETAVWANKNPQKSGEILAKYSNIDPAVIATMARTRYGEQLSPVLMQPLIDVAAKYGKFATFPASEILYQPPR
jgi:NitT/TauT family transport system substrate-binding protein